MNTIKIYQTSNREYSFMDYEWASKHNFDFNDYELVATFETDNCDLEHIFMLGNNGFLQKQFKMRSISVSDIIQVNDRYYYTESVGFYEIYKGI